LFAGGTFNDNIPAIAAISAIRTALGDEFFPPETAAAIAAVTAFYRYFGFVNKHFSILSAI